MMSSHSGLPRAPSRTCNRDSSVSPSVASPGSVNTQEVPTNVSPESDGQGRHTAPMPVGPCDPLKGSGPQWSAAQLSSAMVTPEMTTRSRSMVISTSSQSCRTIRPVPCPQAGGCRERTRGTSPARHQRGCRAGARQGRCSGPVTSGYVCDGCDKCC